MIKANDRLCVICGGKHHYYKCKEQQKEIVQFNDEYKKGFLDGIKQSELKNISCINCKCFKKGKQSWDDVCEMNWECSVFSGKPFMYINKYSIDSSSFKTKE
jgi:hypothetical protein